MSAFNKKSVPPNGTNSRPPPAPNSRASPSRSSTSINGVGRSPSLRGGTGLSRPTRGGSHRSSPQTSFLSMNTTASDEASEDDARAEHVSLMDELRSRVQKAEIASEELQRQLNLLQARLDESLHEQSQVEDRLHQSNERIEELEIDQAMAMRQKREMEALFETERTSMIQDKAEQKFKMEELQIANQRMKETLAQRETRSMRSSAEEDRAMSPRSSNFPINDSGQFAPLSSAQRSNSIATQDNSKLVTQKDRVIESLRLELAEAQIKMMEMDSTGGGKIHELEKALLETKITNARLMEDNESFQLLLSEKTLNGDFSKTEAMHQSSHQTSGLGSLAEELGSEDLESAEPKSDDYRRLEVETKSLKDQNKALALYIENIIGRLLQHQEFENILDKTPDLMSVPRPKTANTDKELPPPPPPKDEKDEPPPSILQRARSVVAGPAKRPRPTSQMPPPSSTPPATNENSAKAPSVPLARSQSTAHRRSQSDMPTAGALVNQMYRGPPSIGSGGPMMSPGISPGVTAANRTSFFSSNPSTANPNPTARATSGSRASREGNTGSSSNSTFSDHSGGVDGEARNSAGVANNYTGAVMTQNRLRPLRLVQENPVKEEDPAAVAARKKANRGSWMPAWMGTQRTASNEYNPT